MSFRGRSAADAVLLLGLAGYAFLPLLYLWPGDGFESRVAWEIGHNLVSASFGRRAAIQLVLAYFSEWTGQAPWDIWCAVTVFAALTSTWLTYLFTRRFEPVSPGRFLLYAFVAPFWMTAVQTVGDSSIAYLFFVAALVLAIRSPWLLPVSALCAALAIAVRGDALPIIGCVPLVLLADAGHRGGDWRRALVAGAGFVILVMALGSLVLAPFRLTLVQAISAILADGQRYRVPLRDIGDSWLKVFSVGWVGLSPFFVAGVVRRFRKSSSSLLFLWPLLPILVFAWGYRYGMNQPRYVVYIAPFLMVLGVRAIRDALDVLAPKGRVLFGAVAVALVFNPLPVVAVRSDAPAWNLIARISENVNERHQYSYAFTGIFPAINYMYLRSFAACMRGIDQHTNNLLNSDKGTLVVFLWGWDGHNFWHQRALDEYYRYYGVVRRPLSGSDPFHLMHFQLARWPEIDMVEFSAGAKRTILLKMDGRPSSKAETAVMAELLGDGRVAAGDLAEIVSYSVNADYFPRYLRASERCSLRTLSLPESPHPSQDRAL